MIALPAALLAVIAFFSAVAPITSFVTSTFNVANTSATLVNDVKNWEHPAAAKVTPPPVAKPAPVKKKKKHHHKPVVVAAPPPPPPVIVVEAPAPVPSYEQPPWPIERVWQSTGVGASDVLVSTRPGATLGGPQVVVEAPHHDTLDWQLRLKRLFGLLLVVGAAFVIAHGGRRIYKLWKEESK